MNSQQAPTAASPSLADPGAPPLMPDTLQWLPAQGLPEQLMLLLHGWGASAADMAPLAMTLRQAFPQAALLAPQGFDATDEAGATGRQWFSVVGVTEANRQSRVSALLPRLAAWVHAAQSATGLGPAATALVGFSQGAICALELVQQEDGIAGRVLSFSGRYARLPETAPQHTTLHFFHGGADGVIPAEQARLAIAHLSGLHGDATIDIAEGLGHALPPSLVSVAIERLRSHIPHRTWMAAMGQVPGLAQRQARDAGLVGDQD